MLLSLALLLSQVHGAPAPVDPIQARIAPELRVARDLQPDAQRQWLKHRRGTVAQSRLKVQIALESSAEKFLLAHPRLEQETDVQVVLGNSLQLGIRLEQLNWLASLSGVRLVRRPQFARPKGTTSEGLESLYVGELWKDEALTGEGVRIAVVDIGFEGYQALVGTELPIVEASQLTGDWDADDHGTAVAEIIHDIAPDAEISLFNFETELEFRELLVEFAEGKHDVDVVNASIGFDNVWHADGSSPYSVGVDAVVDAGIFYVAASGNEAESYRWGSLTDIDGNGWLEIDGIEATWVSTSPAYGTDWAEVSLRWSDPMMAAGTDLDLWVMNEDDTVECGRSENPQDGDDNPFEFVSCEIEGSWAVVWISAPSGAEIEGKTAWVYSYGSVDPDVLVRSQTLTLPADALGAFTVGAYRPASDEIAWYSSQGPTQDGRIKPDIVGPSAVTTTSMGYKAADGTSFAAPHLAGLAALILEHRPSYSPVEIKSFLMSQTRDLGAEGPDATFGAGAVALETLPEGCGCTSTSGRPGWALALLAFVGLRGRRQG